MTNINEINIINYPQPSIVNRHTWQPDCVAHIATCNIKRGWRCLLLVWWVRCDGKSAHNFCAARAPRETVMVQTQSSVHVCARVCVTENPLPPSTRDTTLAALAHSQCHQRRGCCCCCCCFPARLHAARNIPCIIFAMHVEFIRANTHVCALHVCSWC